MSDLPPITLLVVLAEVATNATEAVTVNTIQTINKNNDNGTFTTTNNTHTSNGTMDDEWDAEEYIQTRLGPKKLPIPTRFTYVHLSSGN
ncbi:hypothetical protein Pcinc_017357 [Petrolisthes cinctipes]|uniref:Secreted protein n=1 Tax=Petrolisthes cinctipes TaxID=88211 RepID=A0AAE1FQ97_PETCI|nr:hypothetical protein Pcinc_017357 [Petrolisthes cinctipes]